MKRSTAKLLSILNYVLMFVCYILGLYFSDGNKLVMWGIAIIFLIIAMILGIYLRCPSCGRAHKNWLFTEYCPYCGKYLGD